MFLHLSRLLAIAVPAALATVYLVATFGLLRAVLGVGV